MLTGTYLLQTSQHKFSRSAVSATCKCCGLNNEIPVTKSPAFQSDPGTVSMYTGELKPRTPTDTKDPMISSYEKLTDGQQLIPNFMNKKLKLYDSNNQFLSELALFHTPIYVVSLCDSEDVSLPDIYSLLYIVIGTDLAVSETRKIDYQPVAMVKCGVDILATVGDNFLKVVVIDKHGTVKKIIYADNGSLFSEPYYIDLSIDQKTVYVLDMGKCCTGLSMNGNVLFHYHDQKMKPYGGLAVGKDCLFITVKQCNGRKVRRLSLSGDEVDDLDFGKSMPRKIKDNNLIISRDDDKGKQFINLFYLL